MEGKGVVMYRVVPWDNHVLAGLHHMDPAGPLYSIDCLEGSISYLHLPHCEVHWGKLTYEPELKEQRLSKISSTVTDVNTCRKKPVILIIKI